MLVIRYRNRSVMMRKCAMSGYFESDMMKETTGERAHRAVEHLVREIRREPVPERIVELARELQAALDAQRDKRKED
ncbi:hypothetical protein GOZ89_24135 [Agrobacterium vitis]|uniref:hypothetical protein n=1 Tax=Agrobacterium vitis TaxID=373 RepID=UPI0012E72B4B|nr:hypothetical protein [Agrobacterium vitis]MVA38028.1 hypothetical protein [Agrobacterium vitis]MVA82501.1 hypothetical protein [Agrobacterium vitis]